MICYWRDHDCCMAHPLALPVSALRSPAKLQAASLRLLPGCPASASSSATLAASLPLQDRQRSHAAKGTVLALDHALIMRRLPFQALPKTHKYLNFSSAQDLHADDAPLVVRGQDWAEAISVAALKPGNQIQA